MSRPSPNSRRQRRSSISGFTLVELLVATAVLLLLTVMLTAIANQAARLWGQGQSQTQYRERSRTLLNYIGKELGQATLGLGPGNTSLRLVIDPPAAGGVAYHDSIFWEAPIATDSSHGDLAEVGYFVRWNGTKANLCRFFVNPSDTTNYLIYTDPANWLTTAIIDAVTPADRADQYMGLFLENVVGFWVCAYKADGTAYASYDSSALNNQLPVSIEISLVFLDSPTAARLNQEDATMLQNSAENDASAALFMEGLSPALRSGAAVATLRVNLENYH